MSSEKLSDRRRSQEKTKMTCPKCNGRGKLTIAGGKREPMCPKCKGKGFIYT